MENKNYHCTNGAFHTGYCCDECWNHHPEAKEGEMFLLSPRHDEIVKEIWIEEARASGFTYAQAEFLYERFNC